MLLGVQFSAAAWGSNFRRRFQRLPAAVQTAAKSAAIAVVVSDRADAPPPELKVKDCSGE
jgi:hypothetical protein